jgi:hypothetical protein
MTLTATEQEAKDFCISVQNAVGWNSRDDFASEDAARNLIAGKPAYGWTNTYSNAPAGTFAATVNMLGGIEEAQDDLRTHFASNGRDVTDECWLDNLLPLNRAAEMDLMRAYQRIGTWRTPEELAKRTKRYLPDGEEYAAPVNLLDAVQEAGLRSVPAMEAAE